MGGGDGEGSGEGGTGILPEGQVYTSVQAELQLTPSSQMSIIVHEVGLDKVTSWKPVDIECLPKVVELRYATFTVTAVSTVKSGRVTLWRKMT